MNWTSTHATRCPHAETPYFVNCFEFRKPDSIRIGTFDTIHQISCVTGPLIMSTNYVIMSTNAAIMSANVFQLFQLVVAIRSVSLQAIVFEGVITFLLLVGSSNDAIEGEA
jgi:hypothetical protein